MAAANAAPLDSLSTADDVTAKALHKRYEGLMTVRSKAINGKGAWYWAHLEPILVHNSDTGLPKAVKLRCSLCDAIFSASNPSRTASEHLKRGTCPNFNSAPAPKPLSSISMSAAAAAAVAAAASPPAPASRKRSSSGNTAVVAAAAAASSSYQIPPLAVVDPSRFCTEIVYASAGAVQSQQQQQQQHLQLSGGKDDLGALAMLEDSVKKLKSPKASPGPSLSKSQIESAIGLLTDWLYESCGAVSFSCVEHPKFKAFLQQVGLPPISRRDLAGMRLDARYDEARAESEARISDAMFFQVAADGWKPRDCPAPAGENLVNLTINLPNGTSVFRRAVFTSGRIPSKYAEEILWETVAGVPGSGGVQRCAGIVSDRFKSKALRNLENQNHWMVNLCCQLQGFNILIKDFSRELPLFKTAALNCLKLADFFNTNSKVRNCFHKYQLQELEHAGLLRVAPNSGNGGYGNTTLLFTMLDDILNSARPLQLAVHDETYKVVCVEDPVAREVAEMVRDLGFWSELEAVHSLIKLVRTMAHNIEEDRPLVGQCLPLWDELRMKVKDWCSKFNVDEGPIEKVIEKRFKKNYHPAWSAAFILDPLYLMRDSSGKYLPPFKYLTPEQEKDVDRLITRLVSREEAHIALMELMKWRTEGLDPLYAQAVQMKRRDPMTGKMKIANPQSSRLVWETCLSDFKSLGKVAVRLIFLHATACGFKCNWSFLRWVSAHRRSRAGIDRAQKMVFIAAHAKLDRRDFSNEEEKEAELFANGEDDVLNEVFVDASTV